MRDDLKCPYCGADNEVCHDDGRGYAEDTDHEMTCRECGKAFIFNTTIILSYEAFAADCLNTGEHKYEKTTTIPPEAARLRCCYCGHEKPLPV